jgi:uncharacterized protein YukE
MRPPFHPTLSLSRSFLAFQSSSVYVAAIATNPDPEERTMPTTDTVGVNLTQMAELQRTFEQKAAEVEQVIGDVSRLVGSAGSPGAVHWQGRLADQFRSEWDGVYVKNLRQLSQALRDQSRYVDENRRRSNLVLNGVDA